MWVCPSSVVQTLSAWSQDNLPKALRDGSSPKISCCISGTMCCVFFCCQCEFGVRVYSVFHHLRCVVWFLVGIWHWVFWLLLWCLPQSSSCHARRVGHQERFFPRKAFKQVWQLCWRSSKNQSVCPIFDLGNCGRYPRNSSCGLNSVPSFVNCAAIEAQIGCHGIWDWTRDADNGGCSNKSPRNRQSKPDVILSTRTASGLKKPRQI